MPTYQTNKPLWAFVTTLYLLCRFSYVPTLVHTPTSPCWCSNHYLKEPSDVTTKALGHWQVLQPQWNFSRPTALEEHHTLFLASLKRHLQTEYLATHIFQLTNMKGSGWALHSWPSTSKGSYSNMPFMNCRLSNVSSPEHLFQRNSLCCTTIQFSL